MSDENKLVEDECIGINPEKSDDNTESYVTGNYMALGMGLGMLVGIIFFDKMIFGMIFGMLIGISIKKNRRQNRHKDKKDMERYFN